MKRRCGRALRWRYGHGWLGRVLENVRRDVRDAQATTFDSFTKTSAGLLVDRFNRGDL